MDCSAGVFELGAVVSIGPALTRKQRFTFLNVIHSLCSPQPLTGRGVQISGIVCPRTGRLIKFLRAQVLGEGGYGWASGARMTGMNSW